VVEGKTGLVCKPEDPRDLAATIERYFASDIYANLASTRQEISRFAQERYSWGAIAEQTREVYGWMMGG
jgi:glycosyltransferase involved in cell wall biosynthesis